MESNSICFQLREVALGRSTAKPNKLKKKVKVPSGWWMQKEMEGPLVEPMFRLTVTFHILAAGTSACSTSPMPTSLHPDDGVRYRRGG